MAPPLRLRPCDAVALLTGAASVAVLLLGTEAEALLRYQRTAILRGELWRLLSAHLVHLGPLHLALNLTALMVIWFGFLRPALTALHAQALCLLCCAVGTSLGLLIFMPELQWYVGLSGLLHGLASSAGFELWRAGQRSGAMLLGLIVVKLALESWGGSTTEALLAVEGPTIAEAHLYGAFSGALFSILRLTIRRPKRVG